MKGLKTDQLLGVEAQAIARVAGNGRPLELAELITVSIGAKQAKCDLSSATRPKPLMATPASSFRRLGLLALMLCFTALPAAAAPGWLIATPDETAQADAPIRLDVVKPAAQEDWPETIRLSLTRDDSTRDVTLTAVGPVAPVSAEGVASRSPAKIPRRCSQARNSGAGRSPKTRRAIAAS